MQNETALTRAGFGPRAAAFLIDRLLLAAALFFVRLPALIGSLTGSGSFASDPFFFRYSVLDVLCWALSAAYFILLTYFTGSTLGKKVLRLRVVSDDGTPPRLIDVLYRETVGRFLSGILCLGYFMCLADKEKRAFHDWLCATCVVYDDITLRVKTTTAAAPAAGYSVPGAGSASGVRYSVPNAVSAPGAGYSIPGAGSPEPAFVPDMTRPFPAEEPVEKM